MKSMLVLAGTLLLASIPAAAFATAQQPGAASATPVTADVLATVSKALIQADVPTLDRLYRHPPDPATRVLAAMALERIHFNLDKASADARVCEHALIDSQPPVALFCAQFANGNPRLAKGSRVADAAEADIVRRFAGKAPPAVLKSMRQWTASQPTLPPMQVDRPASGFSIPVETSSFTGMGSIKLTAHGHSTLLIVDTGSSTIVLDPKTARKLGVHLLPGKATTAGIISSNIPVRLGILPQAHFAGVTLHNIPVEVIPGRHRLIGIQILRQLGALRISRDRIVAYRPGTPRPTCQQPMLVATDLWGHYLRMVTALSVDGQLHTTVIDSGSAFYLAGAQAALAHLHTRHNQRLGIHDMGSGVHHARVSRARSQVIISGQPLDLTFAVFKDATLPWQFSLGHGALADMDFYFDFKNRHTCLLLHDNLH